jgi:hypothetical protein
VLRDIHSHTTAGNLRFQQNAHQVTVYLRSHVWLPKAVPTTVATLVDRYLGDAVEMGRLAYATRKSYKTYFQNWVKPKWGTHFLE